MTENETRNWNMFCHLAALAGLTSIPIANILGPLVVWLIKKNEMPSVDEHGKASINFQITMFIAILLCIPLIFVFGLGALLMAIVGIFDLICVIIASIKASNGEPYTYPYSIQFIK